MARKEASILGLPCELRLQIYDYVCQWEVDHVVIDGFSKVLPLSFALQSDSVRRPLRKSLRLPWLDLSSVSSYAYAYIPPWLSEIYADPLPFTDRPAGP